MTYEEIFYRSYTIKELQEIVNNQSYLDDFRKKCKHELNRRLWK